MESIVKMLASYPDNENVTLISSPADPELEASNYK